MNRIIHQLLIPEGMVGPFYGNEFDDIVFCELFIIKMTHNGVRSYCRTGLRFVMNLQKNIQEAMIMAALNKKISR